MDTKKTARILVVEDELVVAEDLRERLEKLGYAIAGTADTAADAMRIAGEARPDVVLMDIMLHGRPEGIDAAEYLRTSLDMPVVYLTAHSDAATLQQAKLTDPAGYVVKPFDDEQLCVAIELAPVRHVMERKTRRAARWLTATLASIGDAVIATNARGDVLLINPIAEKLTGWKRSDALGKPCADVVRLLHARTRVPMENPALRALAAGVIIRLDPDTVLITRTGEERFVDDSASPILDEEGNVLGAVVVLVDATERIAEQDRIQNALKDKVEELLSEKEQHAALGAEVEAFAAAVSHDLRAPLRAIAGFSDILAESYRHRLDAAGQRFLDQVRANAQQMTSMVEDYLAFLKAVRIESVEFAAVDLVRSAQEVFDQLLAAPDQPPARFICGAASPARGDRGMIRQVLINLLGNALKYSSKRKEPVVEFGVLPGDAFHTFFVRDNGAGLDMARATKLFEPFQRFHSAADFPGTGVGLAVVKRIVERHGGRIWAESRPDAGATFFFTLPAGQPAPEAAQ